MTTHTPTVTAPPNRPLRARERYLRRQVKQSLDQSFIGTLRALLSWSFAALLNASARQLERRRSTGPRYPSVPPAGMNIPEPGQ